MPLRELLGEVRRLPLLQGALVVVAVELMEAEADQEAPVHLK